MHAALTNQDEQASKFAQVGCATPSKRGGFRMNESCVLEVCLGTKPSSPTDRTYACQRQDVRYRTHFARYANGPGSVLDKARGGAA
ncbi:MAG: hypothetical protein JST92_17890 [Deltaproteobacteria bacterium]|nr:hypothetical protein [Deltaproteobacteria bacterium]